MFVTRGTKYQFICPSLQILAGFRRISDKLILPWKSYSDVCSAEFDGIRGIRQIPENEASPERKKNPECIT